MDMTETGGSRRFAKLAIAEGVEVRLGRALTLSHDGTRLVARRSGATTVLVNGSRLDALQPRWLEVGDVVQLADATLAVGKGFVSANGPAGVCLRGQVGVRTLSHAALRGRAHPALRSGPLPRLFPAPRLSRPIRPLELQVDDPPAKEELQEQPLAMQIGPSMLMAMTSVLMAVSSFARMSGGADPLSLAPSLSMAVAMVGGSVVWPIIARHIECRRVMQAEARRRQLYVAYLDDVENRLVAAAFQQAEILRERRIAVSTLMERAHELSPLLMNRTPAHDDFMSLRVGVGEVAIEANVTWPQHHFSLQDDRMVERVEHLAKNVPMLKDAPMAIDLIERRVVGIIGPAGEAWAFLRGLLVQVCALFSYEEVRIVLVADERSRAEWEFVASLPHIYAPDGVSRLVALTGAGLAGCDRLLCRALDERMGEHARDARACTPHYLIVCASDGLARQSAAVGRLLALKGDTRLGMSILYLGGALYDLPRECGSIINLVPGSDDGVGMVTGVASGGRRSCLFERSDVLGTARWFDPDIMVSQGEACSFALDFSRARLATGAGETPIPDSFGFLDLLRVGTTEQLDIGDRWSTSDASHSLQVPVGMGVRGELVMLDIHEQVHGPHGLIAGTTGSGKSEFIITYVLSLAVTYAPDEVSLVLIDYKGGGLAGAFDNDRHRLPHLAGTITNLDGMAIHRSLASIKSELMRRQALFGRAREATGEATMDIHKYLSYYRQGVLAEPCPHLLIVADEFAELKDQQGEFMDELISAARIGRSLGIHLILATQKPSGVVNDQIWSNARFKVCLKVSDVADSREMIRSDVAAEIIQPGRFYLLVGYNEQFVGGQAAYAGGAYSPTERYEPPRDLSVELLGAEGETVARLRPAMAAVRTDLSELEAVLAEVEHAAEVAGKRATPLWMPPLAAHVSLDELRRRYGPVPSDGLTCVVGELDDPAGQRQSRLEVNLAEVGNVLLYGGPTSGVDELARTMLVSLAQGLGPHDLWIYAIDGEPGTLSALEVLPQCGGSVLAGDTERLGHLLRMLRDEVDARKRARAACGGQLGHGKVADVPAHIVVALTNLAAFDELHCEYEDDLVTITREGRRVGIHFVMTATSPTAVRMRLKANCGLEVPVMLDDPLEYAAVLGVRVRAMPARQEGRGLVRVDGRALEFQGASVADEGADELAAIAALAAACDAGAHARPIPQLPTHVTPARMAACMDALPSAALPVGFGKESADPVCLNLVQTPHVLVLGNDADALATYLQGIRAAYGHMRDASYVFVDPQHVLGDVDDDDVHVATGDGELAALVDALVSGEDVADVIVFTSIVQTISSLPGEVSQRLQGYLVDGPGIGAPALVVATEAWRVRSLYHDWWKALSVCGTGVWVGGGFAEQTTFPLARMLPAYRAASAADDGLLVRRGEAVAVRLVRCREGGGRP